MSDEAASIEQLVYEMHEWWHPHNAENVVEAVQALVDLGVSTEQAVDAVGRGLFAGLDEMGG